MTVGPSAPSDHVTSRPPSDIVHGSSVCIRGRGALILGPSGSGKSGLAISMMALGAELVADDRVCLSRTNDSILASPPAAIRGLVEARGVGLLRADAVSSAPVSVIIDMDRQETERLPPIRTMQLLGLTLPLLLRVDAPYFPAALLQYLLAGRRDE